MTFRGLEPRIFIEKQRNRFIAFKSVFEFQHRAQKLIKNAQSKGLPDAEIKKLRDKYNEHLAIMCAEISTWACHEALSSAGYDAKCAYDILRDSGNSSSYWDDNDCICKMNIFSSFCLERGDALEQRQCVGPQIPMPMSYQCGLEQSFLNHETNARLRTLVENPNFSAKRLKTKEYVDPVTAKIAAMSDGDFT
jgi:hypothetical protein